MILRTSQTQAVWDGYNAHHGRQVVPHFAPSSDGNCSFWGLVKPGPREQITENSGDGGERASVGIKRKETKEFLLKSRGWEFPHTHSQISGLISIFKLVSREVTTQQCVSIPASQTLFGSFGLTSIYSIPLYLLVCFLSSTNFWYHQKKKKKNLITNKTYDLLKWCIYLNNRQVIQTWWLYSEGLCAFFHSGIKTWFYYNILYNHFNYQ